MGVEPESVRRDTPTSRVIGSRRLDTGFSEAWDTDEEDDNYDLSWYDDLPEADQPAIEMLRGLLASPSDPMDRHFQYAELERRLYHSRSVYESALDEFDAACSAHDGEMDGMRSAFMNKWAQVPRLAVYRQMAIRKSKAHDYEAALWWTERGLAVYGGDAAREDAVEDLIRRRNQAQLKLAAPRAKSRAERLAHEPLASRTEELVCHSCGATFERVVVKGRKPHLCPECRGQTSPEITGKVEVASVGVDRVDAVPNDDAVAVPGAEEDDRSVEAPTAPASWYSDPVKRHEYRYWNGQEWTEHVADAGAQATDPL
jgi:hypothetical protein